MKKIAFLFFFAFCSVASAEFYSGRVTGYIPSDFGGKELLLVKIDGNAIGGCNTSGRFAIDSSQLRFKGIRASILMAFYTQTPVTVAYKSSCDVFPNAWDIDFICVNNVPC